MLNNIKLDKLSTFFLTKELKNSPEASSHKPLLNNILSKSNLSVIQQTNLR